MALGIVLCDDSVLFTDALSAALVGRGHHVHAVADRLGPALEHVRRHQPDVLVVDRLFPGQDALEWIEQLRAASPRSQVVVLSGALDPAAAGAARKAGATGLIAKDAPIAEVLAAIELAGTGAAVDRTGDDAQRSGGTGTEAVHPATVGLSARERAVLGCLVDGLSTPQAAERLGLSYNVARGLVRSILGKLQATSVLHAVAIAVAAEEDGTTLAD